jgi:hypothetical protein
MQFNILKTQSVPYLYRYLIPVLPETRAAVAFVERVFNEEAQAGKFMGRRIVATPK